MIRHFNTSSPLLLLFSLYLCQGLPFGFQATALPVLLRQQGFSLTVIGGAGLLSLPWALKLLWAPLLDRYRLPFGGRRTGWIILLQLLLVATSTLTWWVGLKSPLSLFVALFVMNLACATQDIAVDALAVDTLEKNQLGFGNAAQVGGFKCGMALGGGLLMWAASHLGWGFLFGALPILFTLPLLLLARFNEQAPHASGKPPKSIKEIFSQSVKALSKPSLRPFLLFILLYKTGESMVDVMFKPLLVDQGFSTATIGLWVGSLGMVASISGTLLGGFLVKKRGIQRALNTALLLRLMPMIAIWAMALYPLEELGLALITLFEHVFGGLLTTVCFAAMMSVVDRQIGATHYTALATLEVIGKSPSVWLAGPFAQYAGYAELFALGVALSAFVLFLLPALNPLLGPSLSKEAP